MNIYTLIEHAGRMYADRTAVVDGERSFTYSQVVRRIAGIAACDSGARWAAGERVAVLAPNCLEFLEAYFAVAAVGAICVPLNTRLSPAELAWILEDCEAGWLLVDARLADLARQTCKLGPRAPRLLWWGPGAQREASTGDHLWDDWCAREAPDCEASPCASDATAQLYYTSGTTGRAKGVRLTHGNVLAHARAAGAELELKETDVWGHFAPLFHLADAWATFAVTEVGGRHVCVPQFEEQAVLDAFERERITITNLVPTMLNRLVNHPSIEARDFGSLRRILSGGAPIAPRLVRRIMDAFRCEYVQTYGMTETSPYLTLGLLSDAQRRLPPEEQFRLRAKTGRPFSAVQLRVLDEHDRPIPADGSAVGEIQARGPTVTPGYWKRPDETRAAFTADGFLRTGDLATLDEHGFLDIVDRKKDVIITGGEKVYSTEVEYRLAEHPAVLEVAVFGVPDEEWGESVRAVVVARAGSSLEAQELKDFCRASLAGFKVPRAFEFRSELPRTGSGKIAKRVLREGR